MRGVLALSERFLGTEHADTLAIRGRLAALVGSGRRDAERAETGMGPGTRGLAEDGLQPVLPVMDSVQALAETAGALITAETITTTSGVLEALWRELPSLLALQELRLHSNALNGLQSTHFSTLGSLKSLFLNNNRLSVRAWGAHRTTQLPSWEVDRLPIL